MPRAAEQDAVPFQRMSALFSWWGPSNETARDHLSSRLRRLQTLATDLQSIYAEAGGEQASAVLAENDKILRSFQDLAQCRRPADVLAVQRAIFATLLEQASRRTRAWADVTQKVQDCCAAAVREDAMELRSDDAGASASPTQPRDTAARESSKL